MYRPVPVVDLHRVKPTIVGEPGRIIMVPIAALRIDTRYQRVMQPRNEARIRELASTWDWALYTPVIIAPIDDGLYALIDGQHRGGGALAAGIKELPAWLTNADPMAQARAFIAVNASPTKIDSLQLWHSSLAAGDHDAQVLAALCDRVGVQISRHPIAAAFRKPNVTLCPGALNDLRVVIGDKNLEFVLEVCVKVGETQKASLITRNIVRAIARLATTAWKDIRDADMIAAGLGEIDFGKLVANAGALAKEVGRPVIDCLCDAIAEKLREALSKLDDEEEAA